MSYKELLFYAVGENVIVKTKKDEYEGIIKKKMPEDTTAGVFYPFVVVKQKGKIPVHIPCDDIVQITRKTEMAV